MQKKARFDYFKASLMVDFEAADIVVEAVF